MPLPSAAVLILSCLIFYRCCFDGGQRLPLNVPYCEAAYKHRWQLLPWTVYTATNKSQAANETSKWRDQESTWTRLEATLLLTLLCGAQFLSTIMSAHRRPPYLPLQAEARWALSHWHQLSLDLKVILNQMLFGDRFWEIFETSIWIVSFAGSSMVLFVVFPFSVFLLHHFSLPKRT